jgi:hypothetical protein
MNSKIYSLITAVAIAFSFSACVSSNNLKIDQGSVVLKSTQCQEGAILTIIPSYGAIGDSITISMANTTNKDEGVAQQIKNAISNGNKSFAFYSQNNDKMSALLNAALTKFKENELSNIHLCYIGSQESATSLDKEMKRTGALYKNIR